MQKKIIIILAVVLVVVISNVIVLRFLGNDNEKMVEYNGDYNITDKDNAENAPIFYI